jgi:pimeloyl-ACP methyl ester carboxylesterase
MSATEGVILLHGLCRTASSMKRMEDALVGAGFVVLNEGYPSRCGTIQELADEAIGEALKNPRFAACEKIHFVTHSLGGILVRSYFSRHDSGRLGRVVMLGPPNGGSEVVDHLGNWRIFRWINGPAGSELRTTADSTPNRLGPVSFELGVIAGDRSINWINSLMIRGPDDGKVSIENTRVDGMKDHLVAHVTHPFLMKRRRVIAETIHFLRQGKFSDRTCIRADPRNALPIYAVTGRTTFRRFF